MISRKAVCDNFLSSTRMMPQCQLIAIAIAMLTYLSSFPATSTAHGEVTRGPRSRILQRHTDCYLNETKMVPAGEVRNLQAHRKYDAYMEQCYYQFTWDPPISTKTPVIRYRVAIWKGIGLQQRRCFQLNSNMRHFKFKLKDVGFEPGKKFKYQVIAHPIKRRKDGSIHPYPSLIDALACPIEVKLEPLPNFVVPYGANVSFECKFKVAPFPKAKVSWYFSKDKIACANKAMVSLYFIKDKIACQDKIRKQDTQAYASDECMMSDEISFSKDRKILRISNVQEKHIGCYVLIAGNGVYNSKVEKGYLDLNASTVIINIEKPFPPLFSLLIGTVLLVITVFVIVMYKCSNTPPSKKVVMPLKSKT